MNTGNKRILKNTFFLYFRMIFVLLVSLYATRVVLNVLGVVDYGIYNVVAGFVSVFSFLNTSMINSIQRFYNFENGRGNIEGLKKIYSASIIIQVLIAVFTFVLLESLGVWYINNIMVVPDERLEAANWIFQLSVFSLLLLILQIPYSSAVVSHEKMDYYAIIGILDAVFRLIIVVILPFVGGDYLVVYGVLLLGISIFNFLAYYVYSKKKFEEITFTKTVDRPTIKSMLSFSGWNIFDAVSLLVQGQGLNLLMNSFFGPIVNAARGVAFQIQGAIYNFTSNVSIAFKPQLTESYAKNDLDRTRDLMFSMSKICYLMQIVLVIPIIAELDNILGLWLKDSVPDKTDIFTVFVLITSVVNSINMPMSQTAQATGIIRRYQLYRSVLMICTLPVSYILLQYIDEPEIVFTVTLLFTILNQPLSLYLLHKTFTFSFRQYIAQVVTPIALFTIFTPTPVLVFKHYYAGHNIISLLSVCLLTGVSALIFSYIFMLDKATKNAMLVKLRNK